MGRDILEQVASGSHVHRLHAQAKSQHEVVRSQPEEWRNLRVPRATQQVEQEGQLEPVPGGIDDLGGQPGFLSVQGWRDIRTPGEDHAVRIGKQAGEHRRAVVLLEHDLRSQVAGDSFELHPLGSHGLDEMDNKILNVIIDKFSGGPVGINTISTAVGEDSGTIEEVYEPFLIKEGYIKRTPRGREVTELAYKHLGKHRMGESGKLF